nr:hypothetical protein [Candidatus Methanomethylophilus sp. 1R26]
MYGIELIDPRGPKYLMGVPEPSGDIAARVQRLCFENGLIMERGGRNGAVMRCLCALNIPDSDIEKAMAVLEKVIRQVDADARV